MASSNRAFRFWGGVCFAVLGVVAVYFGIDFTNTNLATFVNPELIGGALVIIGSVSLGVGLISMLTGLLGSSKPR